MRNKERRNIMSTLELLQLQNEHKDNFFEKGEEKQVMSNEYTIHEDDDFEPGDGGYAGHHAKADQLLLDYINDEKVTEAFNKIKKWYA